MSDVKKVYEKKNDVKIGDLFKATSNLPTFLEKDHIYQVINFKTIVERINNGKKDTEFLRTGFTILDIKNNRKKFLPDCALKYLEPVKKATMFKEGMFIKCISSCIMYDLNNITICINPGNVFKIKSLKEDCVILENNSITFTIPKKMLCDINFKIYNKSQFIATATETVEIRKTGDNTLICKIEPGQQIKIIKDEKGFVIGKTEKYNGNIIISNAILNKKFKLEY